MSGVSRSSAAWLPSVLSRSATALTATAVVALAGCSASITRFDNPSFALGEGAGGTQPKRTALLPPGDSTRQSALITTAPARTDIAGLPPIEDRPAAAPSTPPQVRALAVTRQSTPAPVAPIPKGREIVVQQGDTLYGISKRHKVLISDIMAANDLKSPNIKPGQKLHLPADARSVPQVRPERSAALRAQPPADIAPTALPAATPAAEGEGTYVVKPGDSLYSIAARHKVKVADLQRANGITDAARVKPGTMLKIPGAGTAAAPVPAAQNGETVAPESRIVRIAAPPSPATAGVKVLNGAEQSTSAAAPAAPEAPTVKPVAVSSGKLRWPVRGRVIQGFGPRPDGSHNDGVDIAVPAGTDVLAAEDGVVAYAGNEVKTYGNLVLVRHDNGWVTAYAYNDKILVQRGDRVKRGQPLAKAGRTGLADQPQVHFEVRVGSRPVDPTGYLEKL